MTIGEDIIVAKVADFVRQIHGDDGLYEVRVLEIPGKGKPHTASGYFKSPEAGADAIQTWDASGCAGVYITLNELHPGTHSRSPDKIVPYPTFATSDKDVLRYKWLPLDFDPDRPSGISSSQDELQAALNAADAVYSWLREEYGIDAIRCMSGNGAYLLLRVDLPNNKDTKALVQGVLAGIAVKLQELRPGIAVKVDQTMHNAARILRVMGTTNRKGTSTDDRPHRVAQLVEGGDYV